MPCPIRPAPTTPMRRMASSSMRFPFRALRRAADDHEALGFRGADRLPEMRDAGVEVDAVACFDDDRLGPVKEFHPALDDEEQLLAFVLVDGPFLGIQREREDEGL